MKKPLTVDLPMPIEPVKPRIKGCLEGLVGLESDVGAVLVEVVEGGASMLPLLRLARATRGVLPVTLMLTATAAVGRMLASVV